MTGQGNGPANDQPTDQPGGQSNSQPHGRLRGPVSLRPITAENWRVAGSMRVTDAQLPLVADYPQVAWVILAKSYVREAGFTWHAIAIYEGERMVGVLALVDEREVRGGFALFHLAINAQDQGRGLGRAAMLAAIAWVRSRNGATSLRLTVHPDNALAIRLYVSLGFTESDPHEGELGYTLRFPA